MEFIRESRSALDPDICRPDENEVEVASRTRPALAQPTATTAHDLLLRLAVHGLHSD